MGGPAGCGVGCGLIPKKRPRLMSGCLIPTTDLVYSRSTNFAMCAPAPHKMLDFERAQKTLIITMDCRSWPFWPSSEVLDSYFLRPQMCF